METVKKREEHEKHWKFKLNKKVPQQMCHLASGTGS